MEDDMRTRVKQHLLERARYSIECLPEHLPLKGNVCAIGDDTLDAELENNVRQALESGNDWAWCTVKVTASYQKYKGSDYLGGCSYDSQRDFETSGYFEDMKDEALNDLVAVILDAAGLIEDVNQGAATI